MELMVADEMGNESTPFMVDPFYMHSGLSTYSRSH